VSAAGLMQRDWSGAHSALSPMGPQAERVEGLWQFLWITALVVFLAVVVAFLWGALRRRGEAAPDDPSLVRGASRRTYLLIGGATLTSAAIIFAFLVVDLVAARGLTVAPPSPLLIEVTANRWWWDVDYPADPPSLHVTTANEIHVPAGFPVVVVLRSNDVIHSFWPPSLSGKRDLIPGQETSLWFQADTPGVYRGQCAEFCGHGHAKMAFLIIAEPPDSFAAWLAAQRDSARTPADSLTRRGQEVFLAGTCVMCHSVRGTPAGSRVGPDLTHLASRRTIAAGSLPNRRAALAGWIVDPQRTKPGARMPPNDLAPDDLHALLAYLESLE
jgi:cytochrome c oxidase subunit II